MINYSDFSYEQDYTESRLQELRARINDRVQHPCKGRFDTAWDLEQEFVDDCRNAKYIADYLVTNSINEVDKYYFAALAEEIDVSERKVRQKWRAQDLAMEEHRNSPPKPRLDPSQSTLF